MGALGLGTRAGLRGEKEQLSAQGGSGAPIVPQDLTHSFGSHELGMADIYLDPQL